MRHKYFLVAFYVLSLALHACGASMLPTLEAPKNTTPETAVVSTTTATQTFIPLADNTIVVTGNVNVRDNTGTVVGWLAKGEVVRAACYGQWCVLESGSKFWRGCSADNPDGLGCREAK